MSQKTLHSYHIFLFPFKWEIYQGEKHQDFSLSKRANLSELSQKIDENFWEKFTYQPEIDDDGFLNYGEFAYFYDHARDVLNLNEAYEGINLKQYRYKGLTPEAHYHFKTKMGSYSLKIEDVLLNLYENGVGVLSLFLRNYDYPKKEDVFIINDFGRRIYPQYLGGYTPYTDAPKGSFLASQISINGVRTWLGSSVMEDFSHYDSLVRLKTQPFVLPKHLAAFLGGDFHTVHPNLQKEDVFISPIIDDRMFTICIYYNQAFINQLAKRPSQREIQSGRKVDQYEYIQDKDWYQFVFVDGQGISCYSPEMIQEHLKLSSYDRWLKPCINVADESKGVIFGVSRYSFMVVAAPDEYFNKIIVRKHISHQYFQMVMLCLVQRSYLIIFSGEVARISQRLNGKTSLFDTETKAISQLYLLYIRFVNRVFFRAITPQEQGIELYQLLQNRLGIREEVGELEEEIGELNTYLETQQQNRLTWIAGIFLPPSLLVGVLGMNEITEDSLTKLNFWGEVVLVLATLVYSNYILYILRPKK